MDKRRKISKSTPSRKPSPLPARRQAAPEPSLSEGDIRESAAFKDAIARADSYAKNPESLRQLVRDATKKSQSIPRGPFAETWAYLLAMIRLVRANANGTYTEIQSESLTRVLVALIYFVSPLDLIPDWIPILGLIDDAFVVGLILKSVKDDLDSFMEWETQ